MNRMPWKQFSYLLRAGNYLFLIYASAKVWKV